MNIPDNFDQWESHDRKQQQELEQLPVCEGHKCGKRIQDDMYFEIDGEILCEKCMILRYGKRTEDYIA